MRFQLGVFLVMALLFLTSGAVGQHILYFPIPPCPSLSLAENDDAELVFSVFPNPASDRLTVRTDLAGASGAAGIEIYNTMGKLVAEEPIPRGEKETSIDISSLQAGLYFLRIRADGRQYSSIFLVNREP